MKYVLLFIIAAFVFIGCAGTESDNFVELDGPILEGMNEDGYLEFTGAVVNTGIDPVTDVFVLIILKDKDGNIIEAPTVQINGEEEDVLYPTERAFFTVVVTSDPRRIFSKDVEVYFQE